MAEGKLKPDFMTTHHFTLQETMQAFKIVGDYQDNVVKAMISLD